jgi:hypothetical protein
MRFLPEDDVPASGIVPAGNLAGQVKSRIEHFFSTKILKGLQSPSSMWMWRRIVEEEFFVSAKNRVSHFNLHISATRRQLSSRVS